MSDPVLAEIGQRIASRRIDRGYTQRDLGSVMRWTQPHVSNLEAGRIGLASMRLDQVAYHLGTTEEWLLHGDPA